ncbi:MAG TPA: SgcJ/EcaC family oxidoreductase [Thermoanaerobaculia bacterium]|nr:SgcJ/EcaC family oxidoreductase [Thermoanaerobaculia bacterium]
MNALALALLLSVLAPSDRAAIENIAVAGDAAWNARDAAALANTFTLDGHNTILNTPVDLRGRDAIRSYFENSLAKADRALRHRTVVEELTPVGDAVVVAAVRVSLVKVNADGSETVVRKFTGTSVIVKDGDAWRIRVNRVHPESGV